MDMTDGVVIGNGHGSLTNQLLFRIENMRRSKSNFSLSQLRSVSSKSIGGSESESSQLPITPSSHDQSFDFESSKERLLEESRKAICDNDKVGKLMEFTYLLQRKMVTEERALISLLRCDWRFLFQERYLFQHFSILTKKDNVKQRLVNNMESNCKRIYNARENSTAIKVVRVIEGIKHHCEVIGSESPKSSGFLELLCAYFGEKPESLFMLSMDDMMELPPKTPNHPLLIVVGSAIPMAQRYTVSIERCLVFTTDSLFLAVAYLFASFYVFDMIYPKELSATYEFIQRYFAEINDGTGNGTFSKRRKNEVHPKVLKLASAMRI